MSKEKILVVDDNAVNLKLITVLLNYDNYETEEAVNASQALEKLKTFEPNLILLDIQLPEMNGFELLKEIRKNEKFQKIPILAISAYAMKGDNEKALEAGFNGYITKPIDPDNFLKLISSYLRTETVF